jgi:short-subunit dehydrogenase
MTTANGRQLAVVTGASSGIGYELAKVFARNGFDLVIAAEDAAISDAARDIEALGARVESVRTDLAEPDGVRRLYDAATATGRAVDAVAINAGVGVGGPFAETDLADDLMVVDLNVRSSVHLAKLMVRDMATRGAGKILFTSSIAATQPGPFEATYAASKAFLLSFSEALRNELKDSGVSVTALMPGPTETEFFERAGLTDTKVGSSEKDDPAEVAEQGFQALMQDKDHVVAGSMKNRMMAGAAKVMPEQAKAAAHRKMSEPGSAQDG